VVVISPVGPRVWAETAVPGREEDAVLAVVVLVTVGTRETGFVVAWNDRVERAMVEGSAARFSGILEGAPIALCEALDEPAVVQRGLSSSVSVDEMGRSASTVEDLKRP